MDEHIFEPGNGTRYNFIVVNDSDSNHYYVTYMNGFTSVGYTYKFTYNSHVHYSFLQKKNQEANISSFREADLSAFLYFLELKLGFTVTHPPDYHNGMWVSRPAL